MNKLYSLFSLCLAVFTLNAQTKNDCENGRYLENIFPEVLVTAGIPYGNAETTFDTINTGGVNNYPLLLDVYQPAADVETKERPIIMFAFGGAFVYGARVSPDIVELCQRYAQLGYVCVSIDYRLSDELLVNPSPENATKAVLKGTHDMKSAIRFLYRSVQELGNPFKIDSNQIFVGGVSAGAFCALHSAYLGDEEIPEILRDEYERTGGLEGRSGNPGFSTKVAGVINLCGALGEKEWLDLGDVPIVSMHGTEDETVPYDEDTIRILNINYPVAGSAAIHRRADELSIPNSFYTFVGAGHVPFVGNAEYMDTTFNFTKIFMHEQVCASSKTSIEDKGPVTSFKVYPNPSSEFLNLDNSYKGKIASLRIVDSKGQNMYYTENENLTEKIDVSYWNAGLYFIEIKLRNGESFSEKVMIK